MDKQELVQEVKNHLNAYLGNQVVDVILFGSQVSGRARTDSDYDFLIIIKSENDRKIRKQINDLCYDIDLKYNIFLDTQIISENELNHGPFGQHPLIRTAITKGLHA